MLLTSQSPTEKEFVIKAIRFLINNTSEAVSPPEPLTSPELRKIPDNKEMPAMCFLYNSTSEALTPPHVLVEEVEMVYVPS